MRDYIQRPYDNQGIMRMFESARRNTEQDLQQQRLQQLARANRMEGHREQYMPGVEREQAMLGLQGARRAGARDERFGDKLSQAKLDKLRYDATPEAMQQLQAIARAKQMYGADSPQARFVENYAMSQAAKGGIDMFSPQQSPEEYATQNDIPAEIVGQSYANRKTAERTKEKDYMREQLRGYEAQKEMIPILDRMETIFNKNPNLYKTGEAILAATDPKDLGAIKEWALKNYGNKKDLTDAQELIKLGETLVTLNAASRRVPGMRLTNDIYKSHARTKPGLGLTPGAFKYIADMVREEAAGSDIAIRALEGGIKNDRTIVSNKNFYRNLAKKQQGSAAEPSRSMAADLPPAPAGTVYMMDKQGVIKSIPEEMVQEAEKKGIKRL